MQSKFIAGLAGTALAIGLALSSLAAAQQMSAHARAKAQVETRDKQHHNKLKSEGIPTAGGAVAGAVVGGPAGAFVGAKTGHTVGSVFHGVKKHQAVKKQEKRNIAAHRRYVARHRAAVRRRE